MSEKLPDRYGADASSHVTTNNFLVSIAIIIGACGTAVMGTSLWVKNEVFYDFANWALDTLEQLEFVVYVAYGSLLVGFLGILTGMVLGFSGLFVKKFPNMVYFGLFLLLVSACVNIAGGAIIQSSVTLLNNAVYSDSNAAPVEGSFTQDTIHFQLAMFNECCASSGNSLESYDSQLPENADTTPEVQWCGSLSNENLQDMENSGLRTCFDFQETYREFNFSVAQNLDRVCATLDLASANIAGKLVPGISFDLDLVAVTGGREVIEIIGPISEFGCGGGYARAFQAAMLFWVEDIIQPMATAFIASGAVQMILLILAFATHYSCSQPKESTEEKYDRYMMEINHSNSHSHSAANNPQHAQVVDSFEQGNPNRLSQQVTNSARISMQNQQGPTGNRMSVQSSATTGSRQQSNQGGMTDLGFNVDDKI